MPKAYYHREANPADELFIVATRKTENGVFLVDLARRENGEPIVTDCVVTEEPVFGSCTIAAPDAPQASEKGEPLPGDLEELARAVADAQKALDSATTDAAKKKAGKALDAAQKALADFKAA